MSTSIALHDDAWHQDAIDTIAALAETGHILTADDLRKIMRPAPHDNAPGTAFRAARLRGIITTVGTRESTAPSRKGGLIRLWAAPAKEVYTSPERVNKTPDSLQETPCQSR